MKNPRLLLFISLLAPLFFSQSGFSQSNADADALIENLRNRLTQTLEVASGNQLQIVDIRQTAMTSVYEIEISTGELLYSDVSGEFLFAGDMFQASPAGLVNLSSETRQVRNQEKIASIPEEEMIIFSPSSTKASLTVFTDVDCTYCRQLHRDMDQLLELGIEIKYVAYPRGGQMAESYDKMISVWCSEDRNRSLTQAKRGQNLPAFECDSPILEHYAIGNQIGISGTPALIMPDGQVIPGYMEPERLAATLGIAN